MDGAPCCATTLASVSKERGKILGLGSGSSSTAALDHNYHGLSSSRGCKRKWSTVDRPVNLRDGSSLVLELGPSSSSCTTICSGKEMEEESSVDLGLHMSINPGYNRKCFDTFVQPRISPLPGLRRAKLDLELSLSTGPAESDLTSVARGSSPSQNNPEPPTLLTTLQLVDEGSTSSRWKAGARIPTLQSPKTAIPTGYVKGSGEPAPLIQSVSTTAAVIPTNLAGGSPELANQQQRRSNGVKMCQFEGCTRGARGASGLCIGHGGGRRCQRAGCHKGAEGKTVFCKAHGGGRRCQYLGCTKSAEGRTDYCIGHGGGRRCSHEGCARAARGKSGLCIRHGGGKRCKMENCTKSAEGISGLCISHGGGRRCQYPACTKGAQGSTMFCKAHGGGKRCTFLGCTKGAEGSTPFCKGHGGGKRCTFEGCTKSVHGGTLFCVSHGGGKRCAMAGCTKSARGRTDFCVRHGGGKRCKFEGCSKSAQGSTDFCKAHGGGKRCSWGHSGSKFAGPGVVPCDKFARGKSGLCAAHSAQVQEKQIDGVGLPSQTKSQDPNAFAQMTGIFEAGGSVSCITNTHGMTSTGHQPQSISIPVPPQPKVVGNDFFHQLTLPEGRVHGGSLMAILRGTTSLGTNGSSNQVIGHQLQPGKSSPVPCSWV